MAVRVTDHDWQKIHFTKVHVFPPLESGGEYVVIEDPLEDQCDEPLVVCAACGERPEECFGQACLGDPDV